MKRTRGPVDKRGAAIVCFRELATGNKRKVAERGTSVIGELGIMHSRRLANGLHTKVKRRRSECEPSRAAFAFKRHRLRSAAGIIPYGQQARTVT